MNARCLLQFIQFSDSVLPVGAFAFSNGVESAIQHGIICDADTLAEFTRSALQQAATGDARAVASCCRALQAKDASAALIHGFLDNRSVRAVLAGFFYQLPPLRVRQTVC